MTRPLMRLGLILGVVLSGGAGIQLYGLTRHTDRVFAWTITVPPSAAFLGAFYLVAATLSWLSWRRVEWARARVGVPGVIVFLWLTLLTTVWHLDAFHLDHGPGPARLAAWIWLAIYIVGPALMTIAFVQQVRAHEPDPPRTAPFPSGLRFALGAYAAAALAVGGLLYVVPGRVDDWWPWPLTALTGQAMGAWMLAFGVTLAAMAREGDADRVRPASVSLILLGALVLATLIRFPDDLTGGVGVVVLGLAAAATMAGGLYLTLEARTPEQSAEH